MQAGATLEYRVAVTLPAEDMRRLPWVLRILLPKETTVRERPVDYVDALEEPDHGWSRLSIPSFARDWDSEADSVYDDAR